MESPGSPDGPIKQSLSEAVRLAQAALEPLVGPKRLKAVLAFDTLRGYLTRLDARHWELLDAARHLTAENPRLPLLQLYLVDKTEAFHQQVYAALAALALVYSHFSARGVARQVPIRSVRKFLGFLQDRGDVPSAAIELLERSIDYRARFVDHPQQHALCDWTTYKTPKGVAVVYFVPKFKTATAAEILEEGERVKEAADLGAFLDPWDPNFELPVGCESFYVSPNTAQTVQAVVDCVSGGLRSCATHAP